MLRLQGRVAIVTGASSGIGRAIALAYAEEGASVICSDLAPTAPTAAGGDGDNAHNEYASETHKLIIEKGGKAIFVKADVQKEDDVKGVIEAAVKEFGRLDIIVNNAGVCPEFPSLVRPAGPYRVHDVPIQDFDITMSVNVRGTFLGCKYALAQFLAQDPLPANSRGDATRGWIVNIASVAGLNTCPGAPSYTASKHAVVGLTRSIAVDYARDRVHCNAICPVFVDTPFIGSVTRNENPQAKELSKMLTAGTPWGTLAQVEDVARAAVFFVSEDSQFLTGLPLAIDGGYTAR